MTGRAQGNFLVKRDGTIVIQPARIYNGLTPSNQGVYERVS